MGELIIHIDQESGAVVHVYQKLFYDDKIALRNKTEDEEEKQLLKDILAELRESNPTAADENERVDEEIQQWLELKDDTITVELPIIGDLYNSSRRLVRLLKKFRDKFDRIVSVPVEIWEKSGNTVCSAKIGGSLRRCRH